MMIDDTISRQMAIDAANRADYRGLTVEDVKKVTDAVIEELKALPSAQPEPQWIPCSERLPEDGTWCLFTDGENMSVERYKADAIDAFFPTGRWFDLDDAVAWMPLPKPWKGEQDG